MFLSLYIHFCPCKRGWKLKNIMWDFQYCPLSSILPAHVTKTMFIYKISWNIYFFTRNFVISRWMLMIIEDSFSKIMPWILNSNFVLVQVFALFLKNYLRLFNYFEIFWKYDYIHICIVLYNNRTLKNIQQLNQWNFDVLFVYIFSK